jgi:hypothetical protein
VLIEPRVAWRAIGGFFLVFLVVAAVVALAAVWRPSRRAPAEGLRTE